MLNTIKYLLLKKLIIQSISYVLKKPKNQRINFLKLMHIFIIKN